MADPLRLNTHLSKLVLQRLNHLAPLPDTGFLAGGAVANTLMAILWQDTYPVNDLDIFKPIKRFMKRKHEKTHHSSLALHQSADQNFEQDYRWIKQSITGTQTVGIVGARRHGLFNHIEFAHHRYEGPRASRQSQYLAILRTFDLNACQVGIDLSSRKMFYTPAFYQFIQSRTLKVAWSGTPIHTAFRLVKKVDDLKCACDLDLEMAYLATTAHYQAQQEKNNPACARGRFFGKKYFKIYQKYADTLKTWLEVMPYPMPVTCHGHLEGITYFENLHTARFRQENPDAIIAKLFKDFEIATASIPHVLSNIWRPLIDKAADLNDWRLVKTALGLELQELSQMIIRNPLAGALFAPRCTRQEIKNLGAFLEETDLWSVFACGYQASKKKIHSCRQLLEQGLKLLRAPQPEHKYALYSQITDNNGSMAQLINFFSQADIVQHSCERMDWDHEETPIGFDDFCFFNMTPKEVVRRKEIANILPQLPDWSFAEHGLCNSDRRLFDLRNGDGQSYVLLAKNGLTWECALHSAIQNVPKTHRYFLHEWLNNGKSSLARHNLNPPDSAEEQDDALCF